MGGIAFVHCCTGCAAHAAPTNQAEEPSEPSKRSSSNITSQAIKAGQGSVYVHNHCHKEQSSPQQLPMSITRLRALPWCSFGWDHILCLLSKAGLLGLASPAISVSATFATLRLLAMSFITFLTALASSGAIWAQYSNLFQDAEGSMRLFMWHKDQRAVSHCLTAILQMAQT